jgi:hypothetical protein
LFPPVGHAKTKEKEEEEEEEVPFLIINQMRKIKKGGERLESLDIFFALSLFFHISFFLLVYEPVIHSL